MKMKKLLGLLLMGAAMFSSCGNDHEDLYDPNAAALMKANEYSKAFIAKFGNIDPNHTWGFGDALASRASEPGAADNPSKYNMVHPTGITAVEKQLVTQWFKENRNPVSIDLDWTDFWIQQVSSNSEYTNKISYLKLNNDEDVQRFNNSPSDGLIMYMTNTLSSNFSYQDSHNSERIYNKYVICEINGEYYVGFDYCSNKVGEEIPADGYYWDWILKITKANFKNMTRVIAEDLGTTDDFDFNDVIFDVKFMKEQINGQDVNYAEITLIAAGGTLPLSICSETQEFEVHEKFGVSTNEMVNTGSGVNCEEVTFRLDGCASIYDIKIKVESEEAMYYLTSYKGKAPQLICVGTDYLPTKERQSISDKYPMFMEYVSGPTVSWY